MRNIGLLSSGGDSPGMNACIRAIVRSGIHQGLSVRGFMRGYEGLIDDYSIPMTREYVTNIIQRGGTILKTARSGRFMTKEGIEAAAATIAKHDLQGLIVIGGDGSFRGALELAKYSDVQIMGCAGTIDNDMVGTDFTIGYDTAINTVVDAIDKLRDTAESHDRIFVVEVMGRDAGLIAIRSAIASGAEALFVPEMKHDWDELLLKVRDWRKTKASRIIVVAEGDEAGGAYKVAELIKKNWPEFDMRVSILGHIQRGGNPTCMERVNASIVGYHTVMALMAGRRNELVGLIKGEIAYTHFTKTVKHRESLDPALELMINVLGG
jgi:6-phosphofructokinase 1